MVQSYFSLWDSDPDRLGATLHEWLGAANEAMAQAEEPPVETHELRALLKHPHLRDGLWFEPGRDVVTRLV